MNISLFSLQEYDRRYSESANIVNIPSIRVEQGEYAVADIVTPIGTYNMHQCIVLYVVNEYSGLHGLAHVDGHSEILSLQYFFANLNYDASQCSSQQNVSITVFRDSSSEAVGLDNPELNFNKVLFALEGANYSVVDLKFPDFILNGTTQRVKGLPSGLGENECKALHFLQQLKRSDGYIGTYSLIRACDNNKEFYITLDQRSFIALEKNHNIITPNDLKSLGGGVSEGNEAYLEAIEFIKLVKYSTLKQIEKCSNNSKIYEIIIKYNVPINIPDDNNCSNNHKFVSCLNNQFEFDRCIYPIIQHTNSIDRAINIAQSYDPDLNTEEVIKFLAINFNVTQKQLGYYQYDAVISAYAFNLALKFANSTLYEYTILNGQGAENHYITIEDALNAAKIIDYKEQVSFVDALTCVIEQCNNQVYLTFQRSHPQNMLKLLPSLIDSLESELSATYTRRELLRINDLVNRRKDYKTVEEFFQRLLDIKDVQNFIALKEVATVKLSLLSTQELHSRFLDNNDKYRYIQHNFLKIIEPLDASKFDNLAISKTIVFPNYDQELEIKTSNGYIYDLEEYDMSILPCKSFVCSSLVDIAGQDEMVMHCYF